MAVNTSVVHSDPRTMGGTPVFVGSRLPVQILFDYLADGHTLKEFLDDFATNVTVEQAAAAIEEAGKLLVDRANIDRRMRDEASLAASEGARVS
jgi:uncharacterized protein (DUF433 family)